MPIDFIGFVSNGLRKGCYEKHDEKPDLGAMIRHFISTHTDEEYVEMSHKVAQVSRSTVIPIPGRY
jgi:hypothetical protein